MIRTREIVLHSTLGRTKSAATAFFRHDIRRPEARTTALRLEQKKQSFRSFVVTINILVPKPTAAYIYMTSGMNSHIRHEIVLRFETRMLLIVILNRVLRRI